VSAGSHYPSPIILAFGKHTDTRTTFCRVCALNRLPQLAELFLLRSGQIVSSAPLVLNLDPNQSASFIASTKSPSCTKYVSDPKSTTEHRGNGFQYKSAEPRSNSNSKPSSFGPRLRPSAGIQTTTFQFPFLLHLIFSIKHHGLPEREQDGIAPQRCSVSALGP
jgi:hypothetical protein